MRKILLGLLALIGLLIACSNEVAPQGTLAITISGLPSGVSADVQLSRNGQKLQVSQSGALQLALGDWTVTVNEVNVNGEVYVGESDLAVIEVKRQRSELSVVYSRDPSRSLVEVSYRVRGLPRVPAETIFIGETALSASGTLRLSPGSYPVVAPDIVQDEVVYRYQGPISIEIAANSSIELIYEALPVPDFNFSLARNQLTLIEGGQASLRISVTADSGFVATLPLAIEGVSGIAVVPASLEVRAGERDYVVQLVAEGVRPGEYETLIRLGDKTRPLDIVVRPRVITVEVRVEGLSELPKNAVRVGGVAITELRQSLRLVPGRYEIEANDIAGEGGVYRYSGERTAEFRQDGDELKLPYQWVAEEPASLRLSGPSALSLDSPQQFIVIAEANRDFGELEVSLAAQGATVSPSQVTIREGEQQLLLTLSPDNPPVGVQQALLQVGPASLPLMLEASEAFSFSVSPESVTLFDGEAINLILQLTARRMTETLPLALEGASGLRLEPAELAVEPGNQNYVVRLVADGAAPGDYRALVRLGGKTQPLDIAVRPPTTTGQLTIVIAFDDGRDADGLVRIINDAGLVAELTRSAVLNLAPGNYVINAFEVGGYQPQPSSAIATVSAGGSSSITIRYGAAN